MIESETSKSYEDRARRVLHTPSLDNESFSRPPRVHRGHQKKIPLYPSSIAGTPLLTREEEQRLGTNIQHWEAKVRKQYDTMPCPLSDNQRKSKVRRIALAERELRCILGRDSSPYGISGTLAQLLAGGRVPPDMSDTFSAVSKWEAKFGLKCLEFIKAVEEVRDLEKTRDSFAQALVKANLRLVPALLKKFKERGKLTFRPDEYSELIQEGNLALLRTAQRFDPTRGAKFSTYAARAIYLNCARYLNDKRSREARMNEGGRLEFDPEDRNSLDIGSQAESLELLGKMLASLDKLEPRERLVMKMYYGLDGETAATLEEIGNAFALSKQSISNIRNASLKKLKKSLGVF